MNFTALVTRIRREIGGRTDLDNLVSGSVNTDIEDAANDAIKAVSLWYPYDFDAVVFTTTTTADQQTYKLPANLVDLEGIRHTGTSATDEGDKLQYFHPNHFDDVIPNPQRHTSGKPYFYTRHGKNLELWRIPDGAYTLYLRAIIAPGNLSDGTDVPRIDEWWHRAIVVMAVHYLLKGVMQEEERAFVYKEEADEWRALMRSREQREPDAEVSMRRFRQDTTIRGDYWKSPMVWKAG